MSHDAGGQVVPRARPAGDGGRPSLDEQQAERTNEVPS